MEQSRTNRNGTSRCPFVPGQKKKSCLLVPLSLNKGRSKNPRTKSSVPGRPGTKSLPYCQKKCQKKCFKNCIFFSFFLLSRVPSQSVQWQNVKIPSRPVPWQDFEIVPLSGDNEETSVPSHWKPDLHTLAINELLCMKNAGAQIAMNFS